MTALPPRPSISQIRRGCLLTALCSIHACSGSNSPPSESGDGDGDLVANAGGALGGDGDGSTPGTGGGEASGGEPGAGTGGQVEGTGGSVQSDPDCGSHKWACWPMPHPASSGLPNPSSYTDQGNGTVLDNVTGLLWEAAPPSETGSWDDALSYCAGLSLGGYDDWRLPTRIEVTSVLDYSLPGWSSEAFTVRPGGFHRTSSDWILTINQQGAGSGTDFAWAFNMSDGIVSNAYSKQTAARYRCVRSEGTGEGPSEPAAEPPHHYTEVAPGEVHDNYTGLTWQAGDSDSVDHTGALAYCASLELGGQSWRLPSIRELATLVDEAKVAPSINSQYFPDTQYGSRSNNWYFASDEDVLSDAAWALNFDDGFTGTNKGAEGSWNYFTSGYARCVR